MDNINYYLVKSIGLNKKLIDESFLKRGNWEDFDKNKKTKYRSRSRSRNDIIKKSPDFMYLDGDNVGNRTYWEYKPKIKNAISDEKNKITRKNNLFTNLYQLENKISSSDFSKLKEMLPIQYQYDFKSLFINNKIQMIKYKIRHLFKTHPVWIFKPVYSLGGGSGIEVFDNYGDFDVYIDNYVSKFNRYWKNNRGNNYVENNYWVLQEYLTKPLLINERKFHMRAFYIFNNDLDNKPHMYIYKYMPIAIAREKYQNKNYDNKNIHDTHFNYDDVNYSREVIFFPDYFIEKNILTKKQTKVLFDKAIFLGKYLFEIIKNAKCFEPNQNCFEILFTDLMITEDLQLKLIEVNNNGGLKLEDHIFENILQEFVDPIIKPKNKIKKLNYIYKIL